MSARGVPGADLSDTLQKGWAAADAVEGTRGAVFVFPFGTFWEGKVYEEKEVTVYWKTVADELIVLTVKARYGKNFPRGRRED
jgi:hypothetical protein